MSLPVEELINGGQPVAKTAWTVALGFSIGMFPLMGVTTIACLLIASVLRLRQAAIQFGNYAALPLQIILLIPFLRLGERITGEAHFVLDPGALLKTFPTVPESTMRAVLMAQWHMIEGWAVIAPLAFVFAGLIVQALLGRRQRVKNVNVDRVA
jgi:uncharacterized protein (DUF2062 family)